MADYAIRFEHVSKRFRKGERFDSLRDLVPHLVRGLRGRRKDSSNDGEQEFWALRDINLKIRPGETVGVIGHNGLPKKTDAILTGRYTPQELIDRADFVNEIREVKAPNTFVSREGIQF